LRGKGEKEVSRKGKREEKDSSYSENSKKGEREGEEVLLGEGKKEKKKIGNQEGVAFTKKGSC